MSELSAFKPPVIQTPPDKPKSSLPQMRPFHDPKITRQYIYEDALDAARNLPAISNDKHTLTLKNVEYVDPDHFTKKQRKEAILQGSTLARRMRGTWELTDNTTGKLLDSRHQVVARVPHLDDMGVFLHNGNQYTLNNQQRLMGGAFARQKENGELEAHVNVLPGQGHSHRYFFDPESNVFKMRFLQAEMPLMPLLQAMGASDKELREAWGGNKDADAIVAANTKANDAGTMKKLAQRVLKKKEFEAAGAETLPKAVVNAFNAMKVSPLVTQHTLGRPHENVSKDMILDATKKLLALHRGEAEVDDRDHLAYQTFYGPEDLMRERITRDHGRLRAKLFHKISNVGHLGVMPSGAMTEQIEQAILGSGLGQALEEINPAEVLDKQSRISRLGEGGIPSLDAIPDEARGVQPSHMGFMDPVRTPESFRVGVDVNMSRKAMKGRDGRIYAPFREVKTGKLVYKSPQDLIDEPVAFANELATSPHNRVPVLHKGQMTYAHKKDIRYEQPDFEDAFSHIGNLVPLKSSSKAQRMAMGARYLTQALPLVERESPHVQTGVPGSAHSRSFEEEYGKHMGALHAEKGGRVMAVGEDSIKVRYDDGKSEDIDLYHHFPFNRKTYLHQTPAVRPGDAFKPGQLLAHSNYTDKNGTTALGLNARVVYMPWEGYNFEDAFGISESMAKRMSSEQMYSHELEVDDKTKVGKNHYVSLFPQKFDRKVLDTLDNDGFIKPGQVVEYGHPLVLAAREKEETANKIHKRKQPGYADNAILWKHHDPGLVTDVVRGKNGPVVLVKSVSPMRVGDKMSGRYGDKGVVSLILPDHEMPHDKDGVPYEVIQGEDGIITRTNPVQYAEAMLGKIAAITGKKYKLEDFKDIKDVRAFADQQLKLHGMSSMEDVGLPKYGTKTRAGTGNRFFMKLHHTAESKGQGRGGGGYTLEDAPAKGGETGCFVGNTMIQTEIGLETIRHIVEHKHGLRVKSQDRDGNPCWNEITDWFHYEVLASEIISIALFDGAVIKVTKNHRFYLADDTEILAGELKPGDTLAGFGHSIETIRPAFREGYEGPVSVYDITVEGTHKYMVCGVLVSNSKRISMLDVNAMLSHGATENLRDARAIRGQGRQNEELWLQFMRGYGFRDPRVPISYEKFINQLRASGIDVLKDGAQLNIFALTDHSIDKLAGDRYLKHGDTVRFNERLEPIPGGLFDPSLTGGHNGKQWSAIKLHEPLPNPVMEEPIRRILRLTQKDFEGVLSGDKHLKDFGTGPGAIHKALEAIDLPRELAQTRAQYASGTKTQRDDARRRLGYLKDAERLGLHPKDWVLSKAPVLPPAFRPVSMMGNSGIPLVSDPNYLYKDLIEANNNLGEMKGLVGPGNVGHERLALYHAFKAVTGLGEPITAKNQEKQVKGILKSIFGSSPKFGTVQRKLLSTTVDNVGRAVITPNPDYDMDTVGIPEDTAFDVYKKFLVRRFQRKGLNMRQALREVKDKSDLARSMLLEEMDERPVYINRAPVLHRFGIMAFKPKLVKGSVMQVSPLIVKGFNADFDGDAMQFHVPTSKEAVREAYDRMLPSRNLLSPADFKTPMHMPSRAYLGGLYHATKKESKRPPRYFRSATDAERAYQDGLIALDDPVVIMGDK